MDLYKTHIPRLEYQYFEKQKEAYRIVELADQFKSADMYVFATPMWSMSFPAPLKEYIDCIVMDGKTVNLGGGKPQGLLTDKQRAVVYIQSSGANINWALKKVLNKGLNYVEDIMKIMGIKKFEELLVDGTGFNKEITL